jgi:hypothetical protein
MRADAKAGQFDAAGGQASLSNTHFKVVSVAGWHRITDL